MSRQPDHDVDALFIERWSPRSFTGEPLPDAVLFACLEAARWAPSAQNSQPWRFILSRHGDTAWPAFLEVLNPRNRLWAQRASALILLVSARHLVRDGQIAPNRSHSFDTGAAWAAFAHQALLLGWHTHGIGGFDRDAARTGFGVPDDFALETMFAIGVRADADALPEEFRAREAPNGRRPALASLREGHFDRHHTPEERTAA